MGKNYFRAILILFCFLVSSCTFLTSPSEKNMSLHLQTAWKTGAVFDRPDSVVFDPVAKILIVSNVNGPPMKRDGNGYLSKVALNGVVLDQKWLPGFDGPKGMALVDNTLYVADIKSLAVVDLTSGLITKYPAKGAKFLNDVVLDKKGRVYISDLYTDSIYIFADGKMDLWLRNKRLASPNGLLVDDGYLYVASWGKRRCGLETEVPGHLLRVDLESKEISDVGAGSAMGNLDGLAGLGERGFLISEWSKGELLHLGKEAEIIESIKVEKGPANLEYLPEDWELVVVPMSSGNYLQAFRLPLP